MFTRNTLVPGLLTLTSLELSLLTAGCIIAGILLGGLLSRYELSSDTKEVIRLSTGLIGTISALVLGLLIASAKSSYETQSGQVRQITANIVLLDLVLLEYGPAANDARRALRRHLEVLVDQIWKRNARGANEAFQVNPDGLKIYETIQALNPSTEAERSLKVRAIQLLADSAQTRLLLFTQAKDPIPHPFLAVLVIWLTIIFTSFSMFARPSLLVFGTLIFFALSATASIYLILEFGRPFDGLLVISSDQVRHALTPMQ